MAAVRKWDTYREQFGVESICEVIECCGVDLLRDEKTSGNAVCL